MMLELILAEKITHFFFIFQPFLLNKPLFLAPLTPVTTMHIITQDASVFYNTPTCQYCPSLSHTSVMTECCNSITTSPRKSLAPNLSKSQTVTSNFLESSSELLMGE